MIVIPYPERSRRGRNLLLLASQWSTPFPKMLQAVCFVIFNCNSFGMLYGQPLATGNPKISKEFRPKIPLGGEGGGMYKVVNTRMETQPRRVARFTPAGPRSIYNHCGCQTPSSRKADASCPTTRRSSSPSPSSCFTSSTPSRSSRSTSAPSSSVLAASATTPPVPASFWSSAPSTRSFASVCARRRWRSPRRTSSHATTSR